MHMHAVDGHSAVNGEEQSRDAMTLMKIKEELVITEQFFGSYI